MPAFLSHYFCFAFSFDSFLFPVKKKRMLSVRLFLHSIHLIFFHSYNNKKGVIFLPETTLIEPKFQPGDKILSLVYHSPRFKSGDEATIKSSHVGNLYVVRLPNESYYRWFTDNELEPLNPDTGLTVGSYATISSDEGHTPFVTKGSVVEILKVIKQVPFYEVELADGSIHRWIAEFEALEKV